MPSALRYQIAGPVAVLCEGPADKAFLEALQSRRPIGAFDVPFPPRDPQPRGEPPLYGIDGFVNMLNSLADDALSDLTLNARLRGIVIVADAGNSAPATLKKIKRQCKSAGFGIPSRQTQWTPSPPPHPAVAVMLVPDSGVGGLETLCLKYLRPKHPQISACLDSYWACVPALQRSREKQDKAELACLIAAIERTNPTMTIARAFEGSSPLVDVTDAIFTAFSDSLASLLTDVPAASDTL